MKQLVSMLAFVVTLQTSSDLIKQMRSALDQLEAMLAPPVVNVPAGGNAQAALDNAKAGTTIVLAAGASFPALIVRTDGVTLTSAGPLPPAGARITSTAGTALVTGTIEKPAIQVTAKQVKVIGVEAAGTGDTTWAVVQQTQTAVDTTFDRLVVHGDAVKGTKRGVELHGVNGALVNSLVYDIKRAGQDTQAVSGSQGPGPYLIENNDLQASGENILFGGDDPRTQGVVPSDIIIRKNHLWKPLSWKGAPEKWSVKNLFELKNAQRVTVEDNVMENCWTMAQIGFGIVVTVRNQGGNCPWCIVRDVVFQRNAVSHVNGAVNIQSMDDEHPSQKTVNISFLSNTFDIDGVSMGGGNGRTFQIVGNATRPGPDNLVIRGNTVTGVGINSIFNFDPVPLVGLVVDGNRFQEGLYGIFSSAGLGKSVLDTLAPGYVWTANTVVKWPNGRTIKYPDGTTVVPQ